MLFHQHSPDDDKFPALHPDGGAEGAARPHLVDTTMFWSPTGGGVRRYLLAKRAWLQRHRWRHTIVVPGVREHGFADCGGLPLPFSGGYRLPLARAAAARQLAALEPDLIEVGDPYRLAWAALDAGQRAGAPTVAVCHSDIVALAGRLAGGRGPLARAAMRGAERYLRHVYRRFDAVLAPSRAVAARLQDAGVARVVQQPLGVDTRVFHPRRRDPHWRESLGLAPETRLLVYAGRFAPEKNLQTLANAVALLGPGYRLVCVGSGPTPPRGPQVLLLPHVPSSHLLAPLLASADAFVHAGDQESFGLAALEAMACGTPVIVRRAAGLAELVEGDAGLAVESARPAAWAEAIAAAFAADRAALGARARQRAEQYEWNLVLPALLNRYRRLISDHHDAAAGVTQPAVLWRAAVGGARNSVWEDSVA